MKARATYRPMTDTERARALALGCCSFPPASFSKRFARTIAAQAAAESATITEKQARRLDVQCYIYRRQLPVGIAPSQPPEGYMTPAQRAAFNSLAERMAKAERLKAEAQNRPSDGDLFTQEAAPDATR